MQYRRWTDVGCNTLKTWRKKCRKIKYCFQVTVYYQVNIGFASNANANTPAASGAAAEVPLCDRVQRPYKSVVATPVSGLRPPFEKVEASVDEQLL